MAMALLSERSVWMMNCVNARRGRIYAWIGNSAMVCWQRLLEKFRYKRVAVGGSERGQRSSLSKPVWALAHLPQ